MAIVPEGALERIDEMFREFDTGPAVLWVHPETYREVAEVLRVPDQPFPWPLTGLEIKEDDTVPRGWAIPARRGQTVRDVIQEGLRHPGLI